MTEDVEKYGGPGAIRTPDLLIRSPKLNGWKSAENLALTLILNAKLDFERPRKRAETGKSARISPECGNPGHIPAVVLYGMFFLFCLLSFLFGAIINILTGF